MYYQHKVCAIIPAHNEMQSIGRVVSELMLQRNPQGSELFDQIIVCDNASTDETALTAEACGATTVYESRSGYGSACLRAMTRLERPDYVVFVDGDHSVCADQTETLLDALRFGADLVIGSRRLGATEPGALSPQQIIGNLLASTLMRLFWQQPVTDLGPFRAIRWPSLKALDMRDPDFGWTAEMQVKAMQAGMKVVEVPVTTRRRIGQSKISGTLRGSLLACRGIFGTIFRLKLREIRERRTAGASLREAD